MPSTLLSYLSVLLTCIIAANALSGLPEKIYGTNLGSWLLVEPWMLPAEWRSMGGEDCSDCSKCIRSEFAFAKAYPTTVDATFMKHWQSWFTQKDVDELKANGINTVRIPMGYWIVEPLVNRATEFYPKGGILELVRGLEQLKRAGIAVILDHHALPGVASANQMFAGRCTDDVQFYTPYNYHRALIWTAVMTALTHTHPAFATVGAIHAINEPTMDASKTPGYGDFQKDFVQTVRAVESSMGIRVPGNKYTRDTDSATNVTSAFSTASNTSAFSAEVLSVLKDSIPIFTQVADQLKASGMMYSPVNRKPLITNFMDISWQYNNPPNPADAALGPQNYDNHLYYNFGGVADPNETAYLTHNCNLKRIEGDLALGNTPLFFGEWSLATQFNATDEFLKKWADSQKLQYSKGAGWIFWNFKFEDSPEAGDYPRHWSYSEGVRRGYFTKDPSKLNDPTVCDKYINKTAAA